MDPLADKIMVMSALVCFVANGMTNTVFVLLIMVREFARDVHPPYCGGAGQGDPGEQLGQGENRVADCCNLHRAVDAVHSRPWRIRPFGFADGDAFSDIYMGEFCRDGNCNLARRRFLASFTPKTQKIYLQSCDLNFALTLPLWKELSIPYENYRYRLRPLGHVYRVVP